MESELYKAYAELEAAAEAFYNAADRVAQLMPTEAKHLYALCDDIFCQVHIVDDEIDELI
jgi:hypothetical protein